MKNAKVILNQDVPEIKNLNNDEKSIFFAMLDKDGSSSIDLGEFLAFGNILLVGMSKTRHILNV